MTLGENILPGRP